MTGLLGTMRSLLNGGRGAGSQEALMRQSAALTQVYLLEQNRKYEAYLVERIEKLEGQVAAWVGRKKSGPPARETIRPDEPVEMPAEIPFLPAGEDEAQATWETDDPIDEAIDPTELEMETDQEVADSVSDMAEITVSVTEEEMMPAIPPTEPQMAARSGLYESLDTVMPPGFSPVTDPTATGTRSGPPAAVYESLDTLIPLTRESVVEAGVKGAEMAPEPESAGAEANAADYMALLGGDTGGEEAVGEDNWDTTFTAPRGEKDAWT